MKILFITDSASDLQPEQVAGKPIAIVPAHISIAGREFNDFYDISAREYWDVLKQTDAVPRTSMATPDEYLDAYRTAWKKGYTHICVTQISSTASGTMNSALIAKDMLAEEGKNINIEVIDTENYSMAYGHAVLEGVRMAGEGKAFDRITAAVRGICKKSEIVFGVFTLKYLRKCGRVSNIAAFAGEMLGLRPILKAGNGAVPVVSKARGEKNVLDGIISTIKKSRNGAEKFMGIVHADVPKELIYKLEKLIEEHFGLKNLPKFIMGSAVTTNAGPHVIGVLYYA